MENGDKVIVRTYSAGVFFGTLASREGREVTLHDVRRIWKWAGAQTCSQLAVDGVMFPNECKFPEAVSEILLLEAIEILAVTDEAAESLSSVPVWKV